MNVLSAMAALCIALLVGIAMQTIRLEQAHTEVERTHAMWAEYQRQATAEQQQQELEARLEEKRRTESQRIKDEEGQRKIDAANAAAVVSRDMASQLQQRFDAEVRSATSKAPSHPTVNTAGAATGGTGLVLSDMFRRINERATELAQYADKARIAGATCEGEYDALIR